MNGFLDRWGVLWTCDGDLRVGGRQLVDAFGRDDARIHQADVLGFENAKGFIGGNGDVIENDIRHPITRGFGD